MSPTVLHSLHGKPPCLRSGDGADARDPRSAGPPLPVPTAVSPQMQKLIANPPTAKSMMTSGRCSIGSAVASIAFPVCSLRDACDARAIVSAHGRARIFRQPHLSKWSRPDDPRGQSAERRCLQPPPRIGAAARASAEARTPFGAPPRRFWASGPCFRGRTRGVHLP
jgi:hypothetical protein